MTNREFLVEFIDRLNKQTNNEITNKHYKKGSFILEERQIDNELHLIFNYKTDRTYPIIRKIYFVTANTIDYNEFIDEFYGDFVDSIFKWMLYCKESKKVYIEGELQTIIDIKNIVNLVQQPIENNNG